MQKREGPLRCILVHITDDHKRVILTLPNLSADKRTLYRLINDIKEMYLGNIILQNWKEELIQYSEFTNWQQENCLEYRGGLPKSFYEEAKTSIDHSDPFSSSSITKTTYKSRSSSKHLNQPLLFNIHNFCRRQGISLEVFLLSCFSSMYCVLTKKDELDISLAVKGRNTSELENAYGLYGRRVPLRCTINTQSSFFEILINIDNELQQMNDWQDYYSLNQLSNGGLNALSPIGFSYEDIEEYFEDESDCFKVEYINIESEKYDISVNIIKKREQLQLEFSYNETKYTSESINILIRQFESFLENVCERPGENIEENLLLSKFELSEIIEKWCKNPFKFDDTKSVHEMFELQLSRNPSAIAISSEDYFLTYAELNEHSNKLALDLLNFGVTSKDIIAVYLERSPQSIIAILGIMKAGAVFMPLDINDPPNRIENILSEALPKIILTTNNLSNYSGTPYYFKFLLDSVGFFLYT